MRIPGHSRYAHIEREQRWRLAGVPDSATHQADIVDRYITGTRMRLRRVIGPEGETLKFAQKVRAIETDPETVGLTNMYLSTGEYETLSRLPFAELRKIRWRMSTGERTFAVDEFRGRHEGLVLAETELDESAALLPIPVFALIDVTHDDRFSGGALAFAGDGSLSELLNG